MLSSICVIDVMVPISLSCVIFVPKVKHPIMTPNLPSPSLTELHQPKHNLPTPIEVERLECLLSGYNHSTAELLVSGFKFGFPIHYSGASISCDAKNLLSTSQNPDAVEIKIRKELEAGRLAGPFPIPPLSFILWNELPRELRDLEDFKSFKQKLKTHLFIEAYS